jgi:hypothetical protein
LPVLGAANATHVDAVEQHGQLRSVHLDCPTIMSEPRSAKSAALEPFVIENEAATIPKLRELVIETSRASISPRAARWNDTGHRTDTAVVTGSGVRTASERPRSAGTRPRAYAMFSGNTRHARCPRMAYGGTERKNRFGYGATY